MKVGKYDLEFSAKKKMINKKLRRDFMAQLISFKKRTVYFIQADTNVWWKPRKIVMNHDGKSHGGSVGWLFVQAGYLKFTKK